MNMNTIGKCVFLRSSASSKLAMFLNRQCTSKLSSWARQGGVSFKSIPTKFSGPPVQVTHPALYHETHRIWQKDQQSKFKADIKTSAVAIWEDMKQMRFSPFPALVLGFSGLVPIVSIPVYMIVTKTFFANLAFAQIAYAACILSFLGGVRWGFVMPEDSKLKADWLNLGYSVTPSLVAWVALMLPLAFSALTIMGGIAGSTYFDTAIKGYPPWFKGLRFTLSLCALLSVWTVFLCEFMLSSESEDEYESPPEQYYSVIRTYGDSPVPAENMEDN